MFDLNLPGFENLAGLVIEKYKPLVRPNSC
jgi:hypothetical protein